MITVREQHGQPINPWIIAIAVMLATFMELLDGTVVNVSLPHIGGNLSATTDESTWVATSYLVANGIVLPMTGWLANQFGRKRLLMFSVGGFTLSSLLCGMAPSLPLLIAFRVLQGLSGGCMLPISQAILLETFPPEKRGKAMAFWGLGIVLAPMLGPVLGGWITDSYSWRWVFYINLPIGIAALVMCKMFIFDPHYIGRKAERIDYWGLGLLAIGMAALQITLDKGQEEDWFSSHFIVVLATVAAVGLLLFIIRELTTEHPIVDLRIFKDRSYALGTFLMTMIGVIVYAQMVLQPIYLQTVLGYPATDAGLAMLPRGVGSFIFMPIAGVLIARVDARKVLAIGVITGTYAMWDLARINLNAGYWDIFWPQLLWGFGSAFLIVPLSTVTFDTVAPKAIGNAASLNNMMRNIGGSVGVASIATMLTRSTQSYISVLGAHVTLYDPPSQQALEGARQMFMSRGADATVADKQAYAALFGMVQRQAAMLSFIQAFRLLAIFFLLALPLLMLMRRPRHQAKQVVVE